MPETTLFEIVQSASIPPTDQDIEDIRTYLAHHKDSIDKKDATGKTACHYAVNNINLLATLVLEYHATIPEDLRPIPELNIQFEALKEQVRRKNAQRSHLHDLIRQSVPPVPLNIVKNHCQAHPHEINATTYWRRNACHWAALAKRVDYLQLFANLGGDFTARDLNNQTPLDLISDVNDRQKIQTILSAATSTPPQKVEDKKIERSSSQTSILTRLNTSIEKVTDSMIRAMSPPRLPHHHRTPSSPRSMSPSRNQERHQNATKNVSPRNKISLSPERSPGLSSPRNGANKESKQSPPMRNLSPKRMPDSIIEPIENQPMIITRERRLTFSDESPPAINVDERTTTGADKSKVTHRKHKNSYKIEELVSIIQNDRLNEFKEYLQVSKTDINYILPDLGRPYLIEAFFNQSQKIFTYLLRQGASLNLETKTGKMVTDYVLADRTRERLQFLQQIHQQQQGTRSQTANMQSFNDLDNKFMSRIETLAKTARTQHSSISIEELQNISNKCALNVSVVQALNEICTGRLFVIEKHHVDFIQARNSVIGLLSHNSNSLVGAINLFYHQLSHLQKLIATFVVKEIITWDRFNSCYFNKNFQDNTLSCFLKYIKHDGLEDCATLLEQMVGLQQKIHHPRYRIAHQIEGIVTSCEMTLPRFQITDSKLFADELRAISIQFWHSFHINEIVNQSWLKRDKNLIAPTVIKQFDTFNRVSDFIVSQILQQATIEESKAMVKVCINTLADLLHTNPIDLQSAMILNLTLEKAHLSPIVDATLRESTDLEKPYKKSQIMLNVSGNYAEQRRLLADSPLIVLPWMGIYMRDLLHISENQDIRNKVELEGKIFFDILSIQAKLSNFKLLPRTSLSYQLRIMKPMGDTDFELLMMHRELKPIRLHYFSVASLQHAIDMYIKNKKMLMVRHEGIKQGTDAIIAIFDWLKETLLSDKFVDRDVLNVLYAKLLQTEHQSTVIDQFEQLTNWLNQNFDEIGKPIYIAQNAVILEPLRNHETLERRLTM